MKSKDILSTIISNLLKKDIKQLLKHSWANLYKGKSIKPNNLHFNLIIYNITLLFLFNICLKKCFGNCHKISLKYLKNGGLPVGIVIFIHTALISRGNWWNSCASRTGSGISQPVLLEIRDAAMFDLKNILNVIII